MVQQNQSTGQPGDSRAAPARCELHPELDGEVAYAERQGGACSVARPGAPTLAPPVVMMGVPFDPVDSAETIEVIEAMIASRRPHQIATANTDFLAIAHADPELHRVLTACDLVVCDGMPLVWFARLLGHRLPERVAGSELVPLLLEMAAARGHRVFILGGADDSLAAAVENITERWPALQLAGVYSPPFAPLGEMDHDGICRRIKGAGADLLLVAFGCPKQEKWIAQNLKAAGVPVAIGVGATIDFLAGRVRQAPKWMRACSLEWIWRMMQEPTRLISRYLNDIVVVGPGLLRQLWVLRRWGRLRRVDGGIGAAESADADEAGGQPPDPDCFVITLRLCFDARWERDERFGDSFEGSSSRWLFLNAAGVRSVDSAAAGRLVRLAALAKRRGGDVVFIAATPQLNEAMKAMRLGGHFVFAGNIGEARKLTGGAGGAQGVCLTWPSEISRLTEASLSEQVVGHLQGAAKPTCISIDLAAVRFIDRPGMEMMLRVKEESRVCRTAFRFANPSVQLVGALRSAQLDDSILEV